MRENYDDMHKQDVQNPRAKKVRGAAKGILKTIVADERFTEEESLASAFSEQIDKEWDQMPRAGREEI